jgi:signal transduction histidine kinase
MNSYNAQSLFIFFALFSLLGGGVAAIYYKRLDSSARYWVIATLLQGLTCMATVFRQDMPLFWAYSVAISLNATSLVLMGWGLLRINAQGSQWHKLTALGLATVLLIWALEYCRMHGSPSAVLLLPGLVFGLISLWTSHHAQMHYRSTGNRFSMHMRWVMICVGLLQLLRIQVAWAGWDIQSLGREAWTLVIWTAIFMLGMLRYFSYIAIRIQHNNDHQMKMVTTLAQKEALRRMSEKLARLERQQSLGVMSASFAHELNQPLATILNYAELLQDQLKNGTLAEKTSSDVVDGIISNSVRAGDIIRRIRNFIQPAALKKELVDLRGVIDEVFALIEHDGRRVNIEIVKPVLPNEPIWVLGDAVQLSQVLFNVLRNAMESVVKVQTRQIRLDIRQENRDILMEVHDTGPGLSEAAAEQAGDPFYTTKISGLGMGLSISKTILAQFDGRLSLKNTAQGACAQIALPVAVVS